MIVQPQCSHLGASLWIAHSKQSNTCVTPAVTTLNASSYSFPQTSHWSMSSHPPDPHAVHRGGRRSGGTARRGSRRPSDVTEAKEYSWQTRTSPAVSEVRTTS